MSEPIDRTHVLRAAIELLSESGDPEYDRAIVEMTCDLLSISTDDKDVVARLLGAKSGGWVLQKLAVESHEWQDWLKGSKPMLRTRILERGLCTAETADAMLYDGLVWKSPMHNRWRVVRHG